MKKEIVDKLLQKELKRTDVKIEELLDFSKRSESEDIRRAQDVFMFILFKKDIAKAHEIATLVNAPVNDVLAALFRVGLTNNNKEDTQFYKLFNVILEDMGFDSIWR